MNDLVLKGGRVVDPSQALDKVTDIAFANGKVAAIGDNLSGKDVRDVKGKIVSPGLIDLTHVSGAARHSALKRSFWPAPAASPPSSMPAAPAPATSTASAST